MFTSTPRAPDEVDAFEQRAVRRPARPRCARGRRRAAVAEPIIAMPVSPITVRTSSKSTLTRPGHVDDLGDAADGVVQHVVGGARRPRPSVTSSPSTSISLSFRTTISESTSASSSSMPAVGDAAGACLRTRTAWSRRHRQDAHLLARSRAITGAAPVPVPPPMPAVMNSMSRAVDQLARCARGLPSPRRGRSPGLRAGAQARVRPSRAAAGVARLRFSACASVFAQMNSTPCTPLVDHVLDGVAAAAAHADHLDDCVPCGPRFRYFEHDVVSSCPCCSCRIAKDRCDSVTLHAQLAVMQIVALIPARSHRDSPMNQSLRAEHRLHRSAAPRPCGRACARCSRPRAAGPSPSRSAGCAPRRPAPPA